MTTDDKATCLVATGGCLLVIVLGAALSAFFGWLTQIVLGIFGVQLSFWKCWALWIVLSALVKMLGGSSTVKIETKGGKK